jgi:hydrogenase expression/formation protein HypC
MCLAIPGKVIKINKTKAIVDFGNHRHEVDISLANKVSVGDYLICHGDLAINKLGKKEAKKILKLSKELNKKGR